MFDSDSLKLKKSVFGVFLSEACDCCTTDTG